MPILFGKRKINKTIQKPRKKKFSYFEKLYFELTQRFSVFWFDRMCKGQIEGTENIRNIGSGFILAANHSSYFDWLILFSLFRKRIKRRIRFVAKDKLFNDLLWKSLIKAARCIKTGESSIDVFSMKQIITTLRYGGIVGIFPEGTRSATGELLQGKDGVARIACKTKVPIVPVGLSGFYEMWPKGQLLPRFGKCKIVIGEPFTANEYLCGGTPANYDSITRSVMKKIAKLSGKIYTF